MSLQNSPIPPYAHSLQLWAQKPAFCQWKQKHKSGFGSSESAVKQAHARQSTQILAPVYSTRQDHAVARERSGGRCECDGLCARDHTGRCPNVEGALAAGSRNRVRLHLVEGREVCAGCREPYSPERSAHLRRSVNVSCAEMRAHGHHGTRDDCGHSLTVAGWAKKLGISEIALRERIRGGLPADKVFFAGPLPSMRFAPGKNGQKKRSHDSTESAQH